LTSILELNGKEIKKIAALLSSEVCYQILVILKEEELDISTMATRLDFSEAHISEEVSRLEETGLVKVHYMKGKRGIRKVCALVYKKVIFTL